MQDIPPALSNQDNKDFGRERDVDELWNEDEADKFREQHVVEASPDVYPLEPHGFLQELR